MADYLFYTYFEDGNEYFVYKDLRFERSHTKEKDFPFLESLLRFTYLDIWPMENLFKEMWGRDGLLLGQSGSPARFHLGPSALSTAVP